MGGAKRGVVVVFMCKIKCLKWYGYCVCSVSNLIYIWCDNYNYYCDAVSSLVPL